MAFEKSWKVYVGDTDCFGLIYTPVVIDYILRTLEDYRSEMGFAAAIRPDSDFIAPARNVDISYTGSIRPRDRLIIELRPNVGNTSITYEVTGTVEGRSVVDGEMTFVYVSRSDNQVIRVPDVVRECLEDR